MFFYYREEYILHQSLTGDDHLGVSVLRFLMVQNWTTQNWAELWVYNLGGDKPNRFPSELKKPKLNWKSYLKEKALSWIEIPTWKRRHQAESNLSETY